MKLSFINEFTSVEFSSDKEGLLITAETSGVKAEDDATVHVQLTREQALDLLGTLSRWAVT